MNIEGQNAVIDFMRFDEELERQRNEAKEKLTQELKSLKVAESQEFVDWYYWQTDNDTTILAEMLGVGRNQIAKKATAPYQLPYKCQRCKQTSHYPCNSRADAKSFLKNARSKYTKEDCYCQQCKDELEKERRNKLVKRAQTKEERAKDKIHLLRIMPYNEYLQTKHWKTFSRERMREADYKCKKCGRSDIELNVHHLTYERRGCELPSDVIVLCKACHLEAHNRPVPKYLILNPVSLSERARQALNG